MSKIVLITDQHFGCRGDSVDFLNYFEEFYNNVFFPTLVKEKIKTVCILGDTFDRRKYVNYNTFSKSKFMFFDKLQELDIKTYMLIGNHCTFYKNTNDVNSPELLLREYNNITTYKDPTTITIAGTHILMLPWICTDNYQQSMEEINRTKAKVCFGHLELAGFTMFKGQEAHDGLDPSIFKNFDLVCSGHFHHRHSKGNIHYLGNPYQMFWNDYADPRGFHIFDTETLQLEFIENPYVIFEKLYYDDTKDLPSPKEFTDMMVKVIVVNKNDHAAYDNYMDKLYKANPLEVKIIEDFSAFESEVLDDDTIDLSDTQTLVAQYIDALDTDVDKVRLKTLMKTLYLEAQDYNT